MLNYKEILFQRQPMSLMQGLSILSTGLSQAFSNKKLLVMAVTPILIAVLCFSFFYGPIFSLVSSHLEQSLLSPATFDFWGGGVLLWIASGLVKVLSAIASFLCFYILLQVVYIPFCSFLAEAVLRDKGIVEVKGLQGMITYNLSMMKVGVLKSLLLVFIGLVLFASSFLPLLSFLPFYFALLVLAYDSFDYGLELYGYNLSQRSTFFQKEFFMLNGHAAVLFLLSFIPGLLLLTLPFSVIGASFKLGESYDAKREIT